MGWGDTLKAEQTIELTVTDDEGSVDTETRTVRVVRPERKYYVKDHLGSVRVVMDDSANVEEMRDYVEGSRQGTLLGGCLFFFFPPFYCSRLDSEPWTWPSRFPKT